MQNLANQLAYFAGRQDLTAENIHAVLTPYIAGIRSGAIKLEPAFIFKLIEEVAAYEPEPYVLSA